MPDCQLFDKLKFSKCQEANASTRKVTTRFYSFYYIPTSSNQNSVINDILFENSKQNETNNGYHISPNKCSQSYAKHG